MFTPASSFQLPASEPRTTNREPRTADIIRADYASPVLCPDHCRNICAATCSLEPSTRARSRHRARRDAAGTTQRDHRRRGRAGRAGDDRVGHCANWRDRNRAARRQPVPREGAGRRVRGQRVWKTRRVHVTSAIALAKAGAVDEGAVGAGTGTVAFGWKGGIGTSSRVVRQQGGTWTVGVLVQTNYGGRLVVDGVPVWKTLRPSDASGQAAADGSCMIVVATDAPLDARDLKRLAARAVFALARTGSTYSNGSGDFAIAFSTHPSLRVMAATTPQARTVLPTDSVSALFEATLDATEEAVYNSLLKATDTTANGRTVAALPIEPLKQLLSTRR